MGSIKVLSDVLSAASPEAFGRSVRIVHYVRHIASKFKLVAPWRFEVAAALSQLGCVTLDTEVIQRAYVGTGLTPQEQTRFDEHPRIAMDLLKSIPRLEPIAWMIGQQLTRDIPEGIAGVPESSMPDLLLGAKILKLAVAFDALRITALPDRDTIDRLRKRHREFEPALIDTLADIPPERARMELRKVAVASLAPGMILDQEIRNKLGVLVVGKGQEVSRALLNKLDNFLRAEMIDKEIMVHVPVV